MPTMDRWTFAAARHWYEQRPRPRGCNYVPRTAVNATEMWQAATFDPATIDRELGWAAAAGLNSVRVFLQYLVWEENPAGQRTRFDSLLHLADRHGLSVVPCLFDDCAFSGRQPALGPQAPPVPGVHNSGWTPSPGHGRVTDRAAWPDLERFVRDLVGAFAEDHRVLLWDLYNEPGNAGMGDRSLPLVEAAFAWARAARPRQPLTTGLWWPQPTAPAELAAGVTRVNERALALSDVVSFHDYDDAASVRGRIDALRGHGRPLLCTEWVRRGPANSAIATHLPVFAAAGVGWYLWGLVNGRSQTHYPWGSAPGAAAPAVWFHDLLGADGLPHDPTELDLIRRDAAPPPGGLVDRPLPRSGGDK